MRFARTLAAPLLALAVLAALPAVLPAQAGTAGTGAGTDARVQEALKKLEGGDLPGAIQGLEALRNDPAAPPQGLALLGALYLEANRAEESLKVLQPMAEKPDADAAVLYNAGRAAQRFGQPGLARRYFESSLAKAPASPAARELGLIYSRQGQVVEGYRLLRPWVVANPRDGDARLTAAALALQLDRTAEAEEMLAGFEEANPAGRLLRAQAAIQRGDGKAALKLLEPIRAQHPANLELEVRRTEAEARLLNNEPKAAVDLLKGRAAASPSVALVLGRAQRQAGDLAGALATLKPLADQVPNDPKALGDPRTPAGIAAEYGRILLAQKNTAGAVAALEKATRLYPNGAEAWQSLADALTAAGRAPEARTAKDKAAQLRAAQARPAATPAPATAPGPQARPAVPANASPAAREAARLIVASEPEKALTAARNAITADPKDFYLRTLEVRALLMLDRLPEALKSSESAVQAFPGSADALYQRGVVRMASKDVKGAEQDLRQALALAPSHTAAMNDLAVLLGAQGRKAEARALLEKVLAINPTDPMAKDNLKRLEDGKS
jgi:Flp pilus assembly protein TadD